MRGEKQALETQLNRLQHKVKDLGEDFRARLVKYVEDIAVRLSVTYLIALFLCVCVCVCVCVYMYACMHMCMHVCVYLWNLVCVHACVFEYACVCVCVYEYAYVCLCICLCVLEGGEGVVRVVSVSGQGFSP